jgi:hypothetical protein
MGFSSCLLLDMWPKCCDWNYVMLLIGMQWFLGYVKFEQGQKVLQYLDYEDDIIFLVVMSMCSWHIRCPNACDASKDCHAGNMVNTIIIARKSLMCVMFHLDFFSSSANCFMTWQQGSIITLVFIAPWFYNPIVNSMRLVFILTFISLFGHWFSHFITSKWWIESNTQLDVTNW